MVLLLVVLGSWLVCHDEGSAAVVGQQGEAEPSPVGPSPVGPSPAAVLADAMVVAADEAGGGPVQAWPQAQRQRIFQDVLVRWRG